jgi:hypothetical protein
MKIVLPYLMANESHYKTHTSTGAVRFLYNAARYNFPGMRYNIAEYSPFSQIGKTIAIYSCSDEEARKIAIDLDKLFKDNNFTREDFVCVHGDFQVGDSGGIYSRLSAYTRDLQIYDGRGKAYIADEFLPKDDENYEHPFTELGLKYHGVPMPKKVRDIKKIVESAPSVVEDVIEQSGMRNS